MTNPANFIDHRRALMRLSVQMPALVAAWRLTHQAAIRGHAARHLRAWFVDAATRMNPNLQLRAGDPRARDRARHRHHRHDSSRRSRARARAAATARPGGRVADEEAVKRWFAEYLDVADHRRVRHRRARREEQPRDLLGACRSPPSRTYTGNETLLADAATASRRCCSRSRWRRTAASRASSRAPSLTATRSSISRRWRQSARSSRRRRRTCGRSSCPTAAACARAMAFMVPFIKDRGGGRSRPTSCTTRTGRCGRAACCLRPSR